MSKSSSRIATRLILETSPGVRPGATPFEEADLPGLKISTSRPEGKGTNRIRTDGFAPDGIDGGFETSASSVTTDFDWRYGAKHVLRRCAMSATPIVAYDTGDVSTISSVAAGNLLTNSGGWGVLTAGQFVMVTGFVFNSRFISPVLSVAGNDLALDPDYVVLPDEAAPAAARVHHAGITKLGSVNQTISIEGWNPDGPGGWLAEGCSVVDWKLALKWDQQPTLVEETFSIMPLGGTQSITSQIAESTNAIPGTSGFSSGPEFQDFLNQNTGFGFRFGGVLLPTLAISSLDVGFSSPVVKTGAAGLVQPDSLYRDADRPVNITIGCDKYGSGWKTLRDAAEANATGRSALGFGWWKESVNRGIYIYMPKCKGPTTYEDSGSARGSDTDTFALESKGEDEFSFSPLFFVYFQL